MSGLATSGLKRLGVGFVFMAQNGYQQRTLYACNICDLVYAGFDEPDECRVCESDMFIEVVPHRDSD